MMELLIAAAGGCFFNRYRGYGKVPANDTVNAIAFGALVYWLSLGMVDLSIMAIVAMWAGASLGWGAYMGAIANRGTPHPEVEFIDTKIVSLKDDPVKWGVAGLTLRGLLWGALIGLTLTSWYPFLAGATMGIWYLGCSRLLQAIGKGPWGHPVFESVFGAVLWYSAGLAIVMM